MKALIVLRSVVRINNILHLLWNNCQTLNDDILYLNVGSCGGRDDMWLLECLIME